MAGPRSLAYLMTALDVFERHHDGRSRKVDYAARLILPIASGEPRAWPAGGG